MEVAIHEWFAVSEVVFPSSLTELRDFAKISVPYLFANGNSWAFQNVVPEEVEFSATDENP